MKLYYFVGSLASMFLIFGSLHAQVGVGTNSPHISAKLDVSSTTKGFLPPRMTRIQRDSLTTTAAEGLTIYNTTDKAFQIFNGSAWYSTVHYIGESYGGGIVFYVYDNGQHGLIAATADVGYASWAEAENGVFKHSMAYGDGIGAGKSNTLLIISSQGYGTGYQHAARKCNEYNVTENGVLYGDWYLPSRNELKLMNQNIGCMAPAPNTNLGGFACYNTYWSSTEISLNGASAMGFIPYEDIFSYNKGAGCYIRPIRSF